MVVLDTEQKWLPMKDAVREIGMDYRKFLRFIDVYKIERHKDTMDGRITVVDMEAVRKKLQRK
jgi:hypothetical protein